MRKTFVGTGVLLLLFAASVLAQNSPANSFSVNPTQVELVLAPGFNHVPQTVNVISNTPAFDIGSLSVSSDASWVTPSVEASSKKIKLTFSTAGLISQPATATITAWQGTTTNRFFVYDNMVPLNVTKLIADPVRSRIYGIHMNGVKAGAVVSLDPLNGSPIGSMTVGKRPTDLVASRDGTELFVIHSVDKSIMVIDPDTLDVKETIVLPEFENWGADSTFADIDLGPGDIIYYSDGGWTPALRVFSRANQQVLQRLVIDGYGFGDFGISADLKHLVGWAQTGWVTGKSSTYLARFSVDSKGLLTFVNEPNQNTTVLSKDPIDTPVLFNNDDTKCFAKQLLVSPQALSPTLLSFPAPVYAISPGGEIAATASALYETETGGKILDFPVSSTVKAITKDYSRLVYFNSVKREIKTLNLTAVIASTFLNRKIWPTDGAIVDVAERLIWSAVPGAVRYQPYFGFDESILGSAGTNTGFYLGSVTALEVAINRARQLAMPYFWRVDVVIGSEVVKGDVHQFKLEEVAPSTNRIDLSTVQGHANLTAEIQLSSAVPGTTWKVDSGGYSWLSFETNSGTAPGTLKIRMDASKLPVGLAQSHINIATEKVNNFAIPVTLRVEPLKLTALESDPASKFAYGISEDTGSANSRAYLLEFDTETEGISRVIDAGYSAPDLAIHNGDGRIYVANRNPGRLLAFNKANFNLERTYSVPQFANITLSSLAPAYRIVAGAAGRLMVESEDQWTPASYFDTVNGTNLAGSFRQRGGGAFSPDGRYYYHGESDIAGAEIHKLDVMADAFSELAHIRVSSGGNNGSRTVVVSEDGSRVFWNGSVFNADLVEQWPLSDIVYSCTKDGRYAFGKDNIYDVMLRRKVLGMPASSTISAFNTTTGKIVVQAGDAIRCYRLDDPPALPKPVLAFTAATGSTVSLSWTDTSLETGFTLQRRVQGDQTFETFATIPQNTNQYIVTGLLSYTRYFFRIKADGPEFSSDWSDPLGVGTLSPPPTTPTLNNPTASTTNVNLTWTDSTDEDHYLLERRLASNTAFGLLAMAPKNTTNYSDGTVTAGQIYEYRLKATNMSGASAYSNIRTVAVPLPSPPQAPALLSVNAVSPSLVEIAWWEVPAAQGYNLQRRTEDPQSWVQIADVAAGAKLYRDTNVLSGTEYWYRLTATNVFGVSGYSAILSAITTDRRIFLSDDFDPAPDGNVWAEILGGVAVDGGKGFLGGKALWFGTNTARYATTASLPVNTGATIEFKLRAGNQDVDGGAYWNNSESGESIILEYSTDGFSWVVIQTFDPASSALSGWKTYSIPVPSVAISPRTQFRWRQLKNSGAGYDCWAIDDLAVSVTTLPAIQAPPFIIASAQSSISVAVLWLASEGAGYYVLERKQPDTAWMQLTVTPSDQTYFTDSNVSPGASYAYRVKAGAWLLDSAYSSSVCVTTFSQRDDWLNANFGTTNVPLSAVGGDGVPNILKYAFNIGSRDTLTILSADSGSRGAPRIRLNAQQNRLEVELIRRKLSGDPGVTYSVQFSTDLAHWETTANPAETTDMDPIWERAIFHDSVPSDAAPARYGRVILMETP